MCAAMLTDEQVAKYKARIGISHASAVGIEFLRQVHEAHVFTIPFENLSVKAGLPIYLDLEHLFNKIVNQKLGGYCFELNGLFFALLSKIGFSVYPILGLVHFADETPAQTCHRMAIVELDTEKWLVDVGGGHLLSPIQIKPDVVSIQYAAQFRIITINDFTQEYMLQHFKHNSWQNLYSFNTQIPALHELQKQESAWNEFYSTSPQSTFKRDYLCTLPTKHGKVKFSKDGKIIAIEQDEYEHKQEIGKDISVTDALHSIGLYSTPADYLGVL